MLYHFKLIAGFTDTGAARKSSITLTLHRYIEIPRDFIKTLTKAPKTQIHLYGVHCCFNDIELDATTSTYVIRQVHAVEDHFKTINRLENLFTEGWLFTAIKGSINSITPEIARCITKLFGHYPEAFTLDKKGDIYDELKRHEAEPSIEGEFEAVPPENVKYKKPIPLTRKSEDE